MKRVLIVLDGLADLPSPELKNHTPLEAAYTPNLDKITKKSKLGYMYTIKENIAPESDTATLAILGYNPYKVYTGRGPLEAYGTKANLGNNFLAMRANFATVINNRLSDRRAGRSLTTKEAKLLAATINKKVKLPYKFSFIPTMEHRGILIIYNKLSANISNTDPAYIKKGKLGIATNDTEIKSCIPLDNILASKLSAEIINSFTLQSSKILATHPINKARIKKRLPPANLILLRDAGNSLPRLKKKGYSWLAIVGMPLEIGIARLSGMHIAKINFMEMINRDIYYNMYKRLKKSIYAAKLALKNNWNKYNSFYIHIKETDVAGHDGLANEKKKMIELIDKEFFTYIKNLKNCIICITADHSTPCILKRHSSDPVPVLIYGKGSDNAARFTEKDSKKGSLGKLYGKDLLKLV